MPWVDQRGVAVGARARGRAHATHHRVVCHSWKSHFLHDAPTSGAKSTTALIGCRPPLQDVGLAALAVMQMAVSSANSNSAWILQRHAHAAGDEAGTTESAAVRKGV
jgi:hypothetical protein